MAQMREALDDLDPRAITILVERSLSSAASVPTLQVLGEEFGLSRERVRQIEAAALKRLRRAASGGSDVEQAIVRVQALGPVFSMDDLERALGCAAEVEGVSLELQALLHLAGPYRVVGETITGPAFDGVLARVVAAADGPIALADLHGVMDELGIRRDQRQGILEQRDDLRVIDDMVVPWSGSMADKAAAVLALHQTLMTSEEIHEFIGEGSLPTLKNYLASDPRFQRRGTRRWGLAEWGGESYKGIATEMADELRESPDGIPLERLKRILAENFEIVASSVEIMSVTHPMFVRDGAWVRLRRDDEPYLPDTALEESDDCVVIRGSWAWRHPVTHDTTRGSGSAIPEAFAARLRLFPAGRQELASPFGDIPLYWPAQSPGIGSLRRVVEDLGGVEGDLLFVIPDDHGAVDFEIVRRVDLSAATADQELLLRLGQTDAPASWLSACAEAIGLSPHASSDEIEDLLEVRGDRQVLRLFQSTRRHGSAGPS
jgi:DNA polymerase-3 subunit epsilon